MAPLVGGGTKVDQSNGTTDHDCIYFEADWGKTGWEITQIRCIIHLSNILYIYNEH